jgi:hypothetical protein
MTIYTKEKAVRCCEVGLSRASYALVAAEVGAKEGTFARWLQESKADAAAKREGVSKYWIEVHPHGFGFFHVLFAKNRDYLISSLASRAVEAVHNGIEEVCYNPSDGRALMALDPQFIGWTDEQMEAEFYNPRIDRYLWNYDDEGNRTTPKLQTKNTKVPVALTIKVLSSLIPRVFGERSTVDVQHAGAVVHLVTPGRYVSRADRERVIDGEYVGLPPPEPRPDLEALRAEAARLAAEGPKNPEPDYDNPPRDAVGDVIGRPREALTPSREDFDGQQLPPKKMAADTPREKIVERARIVERPTEPTPQPDYTGRRAEPNAANSITRYPGRSIRK